MRVHVSYLSFTVLPRNMSCIITVTTNVILSIQFVHEENRIFNANQRSCSKYAHANRMAQMLGIHYMHLRRIQQGQEL